MQRVPTGLSALLDASQKGDDQTVAQLLAQSPNLIHERCPSSGWTALHFAAFAGYDSIVGRLLAVCPPDLIHMVDRSNQTALHFAVQGCEEGHNKVVARLLAASPSLVDVIDFHGWNVLHHACHMGNDSMAESFLTIKPELAFAITKSGNAALHLAARGIRSRNVIKRLLELNPKALRIANAFGESPFSIAVEQGNDIVIEIMQSSLSLDEIVSAFVANRKSFERFKPVVESQCECLLVSLNQDVMGTVYGYLEFDSVKRPHNKRGKFETKSG